MPHCTACGQETTVRPDGHHECTSCSHVDYQNPAPTVGVAILRGDQVLLAQRGIEPKKGEWDLVGGFIEGGETAVQAAARELAEETGMTLRSAELVDVLPGDYAGRPTLNLLHIGQADGEPVAADDVAALEWFPIDALPEPLAWPHEAAMLAHVAEMVAAIRDIPEAP